MAGGVEAQLLVRGARLRLHTPLLQDRDEEDAQHSSTSLETQLLERVLVKRHLQDAEDESDGFISREDFKETVTGQNDEPAETEDRRKVSRPDAPPARWPSHPLGFVPVIGRELTPPQVGGGDDAAAFVLTVPDRARHLEDAQDSAVPATQ